MAKHSFEFKKKIVQKYLNGEGGYKFLYQSIRSLEEENKLDYASILGKGEYISGLGIKKSLFSLGNKIDIFSNRKGCSRRFLLDVNSVSDELISQSESIDYNPNATEGTNIFISDLENNINKQIINSSCIDNILAELGRRCSKFIKKENL
ncbi:hypothetical protein [Clostridium sp. KNHs214]|uniref:hypothetical protein n=1 Tax=Clostridium sp. KNHs214 TaxID=1540257 RepID=UPI00054EB9FF|nr:hypothetical protein [Clostridium sp. KNHs214]